MLSSSLFLLPEGRARLRVFESTCLKTISLAAKKGGLVLSPPFDINNVKQTFLGSLVVIDDFNQGDGSLLELDIFCKSIVEITATKLDKNKLLLADIEMFKHWSQEVKSESEIENVLASSLNEILNQDSMLNSLYQDRALNNNSWVIARWLELLPVDVKVKRSFIDSNGFIQAKNFIESIVF